MTRRITLAIVAALTALLLATGLAAAQDPPETATATRLEPGLNLVGWVGEPTPVSQLFREIPRLEAIWAWDAELRDWIVAAPNAPEWLGGLGRVTAGMGLRMQLGGDQSFVWQRSTEPTRGLVKLRTGWNLVAWSGADGAAIGDVVKGIGWSLRTVRRWDAAIQEWIVWTSPERSAQVIANTGADQDADSDAEMPGIRRGEALWIEVARAVNWLQPTDILPRLVFPGGASDELQARVREDLRATLAFFRDQYGIQAEPDFTIYIAKDVDALIQALQDDGQSLRSRWERLDGQATPSDVWAKQSTWRNQRSSRGRDILTHEYSHIVQYQLQGERRSAVPEWIVEGTADWTEKDHEVLDGVITRGDLRESRLSAIADAPTLRSTERKNAKWQYDLGWLAMDRLIREVGADSWIEFYRQFVPTEIGPHRRWISRPDWQTVFQGVFGRPVSEFYADFDAWQREQGKANPTTTNSYDGNWIRGHVTREGGAPVAGVFVNAVRVDGETSVGWNQRAETAADGTFAVRAPEDGDYRLSVDFTDDCDLYYYSDGELINEWTEAQPITVAGRDVRDIDVQLPANMCRWQIRGYVVGPDGEPLAGIPVSAGCSTTRHCLLNRSAADGSFAVTVNEPADHRISANLGDGCLVFFRSGDTTTNWNSASPITPVTVANAHVGGIVVRVSEEMCVYQITGAITQANGQPLADTQIRACLEVDGDEDCTFWNIRNTDADGAFAIKVPTEGRYFVSFNPPGCGTIYYIAGGFTTARNEHTTVSVEGRDVHLGHSQIPLLTCSRQIRGSITQADGQPLADTYVDACAVVDDSCTRMEGATTNDDGSFTIAVPPEGYYRLEFDLNGCTIYLGSASLTETRSKQFAVYVGRGDVNLGHHQIPRGMCAPQIIGSITKANGQPLANTHISGCLVVDGSCAETVDGRTDGTGAFAITAATDGEYRLNFDLEGCTIYFSSDGLTATRGERSTVRVEGRDLRLSHRRIPNGVCQHRITGRVVDSDGAPLSGKLVIVRGPLGSAAAQTDLPASTDAGGSFDILVPSDGAYSFGMQLRAQPYCWYNFDGAALGSPGNPVRVEGADAAGVVLRPPATIEELCE